MPKTIQIRQVRKSVHRKLKARAAKRRMSLSGYLLEEIKSLANRPTEDELDALLTKSAGLIRADRKRHMSKLGHAYRPLNHAAKSPKMV